MDLILKSSLPVVVAIIVKEIFENILDKNATLIKTIKNRELIVIFEYILAPD